MIAQAFKDKDEDLGELVEDLLAFTSDRLSDLVTAVDEDDLKEWGHYSEERLVDKSCTSTNANSGTAISPCSGVLLPV